MSCSPRVRSRRGVCTGRLGKTERWLNQHRFVVERGLGGAHVSDTSPRLAWLEPSRPWGPSPQGWAPSPTAFFLAWVEEDRRNGWRLLGATVPTLDSAELSELIVSLCLLSLYITTWNWTFSDDSEKTKASEPSVDTVRGYCSQHLRVQDPPV